MAYKPRTTTANGIELITTFEGFRAKAYRPVKGERFLTIGYGHYGPDVRAGQEITRQLALLLLRRDLAKFELAVNNACREAGWQPNAHQFDALVSIVFNCGPAILEPDRSLGRALRARRPRLVAASFLLYVKGGQPLRTLLGLVRRRRAERKLFLLPVSEVKPKPKRRRRPLNQTVAFDGVPCFRGHALMLADARAHGWNGKLNSADRREGVAEKYGRLSQVALWLGWLARKPGFLPANPPGKSTHELRSDGVAYRGPVGRPLAWWQLGLDTTDAITLRVVLSRLCYGVKRPYASRAEVHHTNLTRNPRRRLVQRKRW